MKCKVTCVKVWMGLAVSGCIITLVLAAIVLSSYSFESVIGPLPCKLKKIETRNCCYDDDCIYGKQYIYYFSSNSTHCMNQFDLYNHPTNSTVRFREETSCYSSVKSLSVSSPDWNVNESMIFYVNNDCTQWIESSLHIEHVSTNIMWIAIILSFVGCSCVSMICGFITMYHLEILSCLFDYCACDCSENIFDKYLYHIEYDSDDTLKNNKKRKRLSSATNSSSPATNNKPIAVVLKGNSDKSRSIHFNNEIHKESQRKYSKESQISRLSPISASKDNQFKQFAADKKGTKIQTHKREKQLKHRVYTNANVDEYKSDDDDESKDEESESAGLSDVDRVYDDEWYNDTTSRTTGRSNKNSNKHDDDPHRNGYHDVFYD